jgi:hypothetical protein
MTKDNATPTVRSNVARPTSTNAAQAQSVRHFYQEDLARRWGMSPRTLERWRSERTGPPYLKIRGRILYRVEDVQQFELSSLRDPSGDAGH